MAWRHGDDKNDEYREGWRWMMLMMLISKGRQDHHPHQYSFLVSSIARIYQMKQSLSLAYKY